MGLGMIVAALVFSAPSKAAEADSAQLAGAGSQSCAQFAKAYSANPTFAENAYFTWAQGFMTGFNLAAMVLVASRAHMLSVTLRAMQMKRGTYPGLL